MPKIRFAMLLAGFGMLCSLAAIASLGLVVLSLFQQQSPWLWFWVGAGFLLLAVASRSYAFRISHLAAFRLENLLRTELSQKIARLPLGYLINKGSGAINKVVLDDVKNLHTFVADSTPLIGRSFVAPPVMLIIMLYLDWRLALAAVMILVVAMFAMSLGYRDSEILQIAYDQANERISATVIEFIQAMPVVRTFDSGSDSFTRFQTHLSDFRRFIKEWLAFAARPVKLAGLLLGPLFSMLVLVLSGVVLMKLEFLSIEYWIFFLLLGTGFSESIMPLMWLNRFIRQANLSATRIRQLQAEPELPAGRSNPKITDHSLEFDAVSFGYESGGRLALDKVSFQLPSGSVTALVGPSGSGKSTIARLIPRFWDVSVGEIRLGGIDIRDFTSHALMDQMAFVFQDNFLFNDTIAENIAFGMEDVSNADILAAAKSAQAHDFITGLADGYQTRVGDRGSQLSGGQRQRITIARAILQNRPIIVLDEATAYADPENEAAMVKALAHLTRNKTVLLIAHRLNTVCHADQILVMNHGKLVEHGKHDDLLRQEGMYHRLWQHHLAARDWRLSAHQSVEDLS